MTERYNTPAEGTLDWHIPLNENFNKLDRHVEIRDVEDNRDQYEPKSGSKYLATDTGAVYLGNGSQWDKIGAIDSSGSTTTADDGIIIAQPGDIQSAIDDATDSTDWGQVPSRTVRLVSGKNYYPSSTINVKRNVRLECNGARIVPNGDFNVFEMYRASQLIDPFIDTRSVNWSSTQIVVGADDASKVGGPNRAAVREAMLLGSPQEGIGLQFRGGSNAPCSMQRASGHINGFDKAIDVYATGSDTSGQGDWSNGNQFYGSIQNFRIGVNMRSEGAEVSGNTFRCQAQHISGNTEWLWYVEDDPRSESERGDNIHAMRGNTMHIYPWDAHNVTNSYEDSDDRRAPIWYLGRGMHYANALVDLSGKYGNQFIVNNSDHPDRNGCFTYHGGDVTGTHQFSHPPAYQQNGSRIWHEDSTN
jgi:hypothetical protein